MSNEELEKIVADALKRLPPGVVLLTAVSGGADSIAMLTALAAVMGDGTAFSLRCVHVEHGIRPAEESKGDAEFTRRFCKDLGIPCRIVSIPFGKIEETAKKHNMGIEAAARLFRRRIFFREARRIEAETGAAGLQSPVMIATAHTKDDMLETVLMRVLRGSGPSGLAAMPAVRGRFFRPVLELSRHDIIAYLTEKNIGWREDFSNADTVFFRNRVRHRLIPLLEELSPQWRTAVTALAETQALTAAFIKHEAKKRVKWLIEGKERETLECNDSPLPTPHSPFPISTDAENFFSQPEIIREEALFQGISRLQKGLTIPREVKRLNIRRFCRGEITAADLGPVRLNKNSQQVTISAVAKAGNRDIPHSFETSFSLLINTPGLYKVKEVTVEVKPYCKEGGAEKGFFAFLPLVLRPAQEDSLGGSAGGAICAGGLNCAGSAICAVDRFGAAAIIGTGNKGGVLAVRDDFSIRKETDPDVFCVVRGI